MSLSIIQRKTGSSATNTASAVSLTFDSAVIGSDGIIVVVSSRQAVNLNGMADNKGNVYSRDLAGNVSSGSGYISIWHAEAVGSGTPFTVTMTMGGTGSRPYAWAILEVSEAVELNVAQTKQGTSNAPATGPLTSQALNREQLSILAVNAGIAADLFTAEPAWNRDIWTRGSTEGVVSDLMDTIFTWTSATGVANPVWGLGTSVPWVAGIAHYNSATSTPSPGIPTFLGGPFLGPPMPGAPWFAQQYLRYGSPPPVAAPSTAPQMLLVPSVPETDDQSRLERSLRDVAAMINSLFRQQILARDELDSFLARAGGFLRQTAPTSADNSTIGARTGTPWVNESTSPASAYIFVSDSLGWVQLKVISTAVPSGGATGTFP